MTKFKWRLKFPDSGTWGGPIRGTGTSVEFTVIAETEESAKARIEEVICNLPSHLPASPKQPKTRGKPCST